MRVIHYGRVSTEEQAAKGASLEAQRDAVAEECERRGWEIVEVIEDVASGKNMGRPGIIAATTALKRGEADALIVSKLDRSSGR